MRKSKHEVLCENPGQKKVMREKGKKLSRIKNWRDGSGTGSV